jgi:hypothetical protein
MTDLIYKFQSEVELKLEVGQWVEILEAYTQKEIPQPIEVKTLRTKGRTLRTALKSKTSKGGCLLRPHEGKIVAIANNRGWTRFRISLTG